MKNLFIASVLLLSSAQAFALPVCPPVPGEQFRTIYNLFDSAVTGATDMKAESSCASLNIRAGERYQLLASPDALQIFGGSASVQVLVPSEGDYITNDTCASPSINSNEFQSFQGLSVFKNSLGRVTVQFAGEQCELRECPQFGPCN